MSLLQSATCLHTLLGLARLTGAAVIDATRSARMRRVYMAVRSVNFVKAVRCKFDLCGFWIASRVLRVLIFFAIRERLCMSLAVQSRSPCRFFVRLTA